MNNLQKTDRIRPLLDTLCSDNGMERKKARNELVKEGGEVIDYLVELLQHRKHTYRWEAVKTLEQIADPKAIPAFLLALEDNESDIRWIAAEGLIAIGEEAVIPLLKTLIEKSESVFIMEAAHHIIKELKEKDELPLNFPTNQLLEQLQRHKADGSEKHLYYTILKQFHG